MVSLKWDLSLSYLALFSVEVLELIDAHSTIAVSHQDTVCLRREEQVLHVHPGARRLYYYWLLTEDNTEDPSIQLRLGKPEQPIHQITGRAQAISHVQTQVPDLQLSLTDSTKHCRLPVGPLDVLHSSMDAGKGQQGTEVVLLPELDCAVRGAAEEHIRAEWRPSNCIHGTLRMMRKI